MLQVAGRAAAPVPTTNGTPSSQGAFSHMVAFPPDLSDVTLGEVNEDSTVYLVPECDDDSEMDEILEENYAAIFEEQVSAWSQDPDDWPDVNDFQTFREWFDVESHSLVVDLGSGPVETDERQ